MQSICLQWSVVVDPHSVAKVTRHGSNLPSPNFVPSNRHCRDLLQFLHRRCETSSSTADAPSSTTIITQPFPAPALGQYPPSPSAIWTLSFHSKRSPETLRCYYTTRLWIGTPPQEFSLIVDTGSTVTYVPCASCAHCGKHQDPRFQPDLSSTYQPVKCNPSCNCDDEKKQCTYDRRYAEMSSSSGVLGEDLFHSGMRGRLSIMDQLVDKNVIGDSFSLCYGGMDVGEGAMVLGNITPPPEMVYSHSDPFRSPYYNIELKEMHVAGKRLKLPAGVFDGRHGTVLDSGTTYAYLPKDAFVAFRDAVLREVHFLKRVHGPDPNFHDICVSGAGRDVSQLSKIFPEVEMVLNNGNKLLLSPENYLFRHTKLSGAYCLGIFPNSESTTLLGGIVVRNTLVTYDRGNDRIGFLKTDCSELWMRVRSSVAPAPLVSLKNDTNREISPAPTPSGSPPNVFPGTFHIGFITFDMSISTNDSKSKLNFKELGELISKELEVDNSQVRLLNVTSKGNEYLVRWGIFPASPANYISNSTASSIILRLRDHRMQFPERFGNYNLVEWNAEPQRKSSWWRHHFVALVLGFIATLSLSAIGIWLFVRHRRQSITAYEPVASPIAEQELQPLQS
ncbi:putative pumilio-like protein 7 [Hibiscus syriacus]|uniref:Pumilio-like protein 7 n=1 Tax=Hibiscus syriacus TaxID=106335 RepID=A0A6A2YHP8_HIBSY|nr:putative pumilio-like protein 7 [Hibiscus syriacus]